MINSKNTNKCNSYQRSLFYHKWNLASVVTAEQLFTGIWITRCGYNDREHNAICGFKAVGTGGGQSGKQTGVKILSDIQCTSPSVYKAWFDFTYHPV